MSESASASHPLIEELLAGLAEARAEVGAAVDAVPEELRGARPAPDRWSVAEILEHLALVERSVTGRLGADAPEPPEVPAGERFVYDRAAILDRSHRADAPERGQPTGTLTWREAWHALAVTRAALEATLRATDPERLARVRLPHPAFGTVDGVGWARLLGGHEERHAAQIRENGAALAG